MSDEINEAKTELAQLCAAFMYAVIEFVEEDPGLVKKAKESITQAEETKLEKMNTELAAANLSAAFGAVTDKSLNLNIKSAEMTVDFCHRFLNPSITVQFVPDGLKNEESIRLLEANNAPKFAALCRQSI